MEGHTMTTPAGWYDDPMTPGGKRYWDGMQWTEHVQAPPAPVPGAPPPAPDPYAQPAPFAPSPVGGFNPNPSGVEGGPTFDGKINDLGQWLGRSFKGVGRRFVPLSVLALIQIVAFVVAYVFIDQALRGIVLEDFNGGIEINVGLIVAAGVLSLVAGIVAAITWLAAQDQLYAAHINREVGLGESLATGLRKAPAMIAVFVLLYLGFIAVSALVLGGGVALFGEAGLAISIPLFILLMLFGIYLMIRYLLMYPVALAVVPSGVSGLDAAGQATRGRFWPIFGRVLLLGIVLWIFSAILSVIQNVAFSALFASVLEFTPEGSVLIDGQDVENIDRLAVESVLPNVGATAAVFALIGYLNFLLYSVTASGSAAIYADVSAPNKYGHTHLGDGQHHG